MVWPLVRPTMFQSKSPYGSDTPDGLFVVPADASDIGFSDANPPLFVLNVTEPAPVVDGALAVDGAMSSFVMVHTLLSPGLSVTIPFDAQSPVILLE